MQRLVFLALAWVWLTGCGGKAGPPTTPPAAVGVQAYVSALRADDAKQAYALLSSDVKAELSFEDFARQWKRSVAEREAQAEALDQALEVTSAGHERAEVVYPDGKTVYLVRERGAWRLESAVVSRYHAGQPGQAVEQFAQALARRDYDAVMRTLTERRRAGIDEQMQRFVDSLQATLDSKEMSLEVIGEDRAELRWDDGTQRYRIVLRKEGQEWRVDDIHMRPMPNEEDSDE